MTVVTAVYNGARFLHEAITSVLTQTYRDFELIVVDDSSSDNSLSVLQNFSDPRMRIITHHTNLGVALSRNDALIAARGELIAIMDADDVCTPTRLERQVAFLDAHPEVGLVGCGVYDNIDEDGRVLCTSLLPAENRTIQRVIMDRWCFLHSSLMYRRTVQQLVGGYREVFEPAEDHDFVLRALEHCQAHNLDECLVSYRLNPKGLSVNGHRYIDELRRAAIQAARSRRSGQPENVEIETLDVRKSSARRRDRRGFDHFLQWWRESWYAADRYYTFGCGELCGRDFVRARRCFVQSLRMNSLFAKSWVGFALSLMPATANRLRFALDSMMQRYDEVDGLRSSITAAAGQAASTTERPADQ